jgi:hypothetical protein
MNDHSPEAPRVAALFPDLTPEAATRAEHNMEAYLALVRRVYARMCADPQARAIFQAARKAQEAADRG